MLYGYVKIGQVPVSDTGTSKTRLENVPITYSVFILNTGEGKKEEDIQPLLLCSLSSLSCKAIPP